MTSRQLYEDWKKEEAAARMEGWDFSHLRGRYEEGRDIPWDYDAIVRACRRDALLRLHRQLEQTGMLEGTTHRFLIVAQKQAFDEFLSDRLRAAMFGTCGRYPVLRRLEVKEETNMILLIAGAAYTGKTLLAQRLLEKYHYPCLSIDHLKMGLIRSGQTSLTPESSTEALTEYLWPILREMIKTALENGQNLIIEGSYIPFDWEKSFTAEERQQMRYLCLVMSEHYIHSHFADILMHANVIEHRLPGLTNSMKYLLNENAETRVSCRLHGAKLLRIDEEYPSADEMIAALMEQG